MIAKISHNDSATSAASLTNELPQNWQVVRLDQVTREFISGGTPSTKEPKFWDGAIAWTTSAPISEEDVSLSKAQRFITQEGLQNSSSHLVPKSSLLVGTRVGVGKAVVNRIDVAISQDLTGIVLDSSQVDAEFVAYQFKTEKAQKFFDGRKRGTTIKGISRFDLESLNLYVPPLPEQRAIAHALRSVQEVKEARQRELTLERERKAALMQHLFTYGTRGELQQQTEIGEIPESWQTVKLGEIAEIRTGTTPSTEKLEYYDGDISFIKTSEIANNRIVEAQTHISNQAVTDYNLRIYPPGTVFMAMYGQGKTRGQAAILEIPAATTQNTAAILFNSEVDKEYAWQWLMGQYEDLRGAGSQGHISHLNLGYVKEYKISLPRLSEQHEIANVLRASDAKIAALENEAIILDELFRAMLEELMTGRLSAVPLIAESTNL